MNTRFKDKSAKLGIIGLGYVGLPLAVEFASAGYTVVGFDVAADKVEGVNHGVSHVRDVRSEDLAKIVGSGRLTATTDFTGIRELASVNICVPTPLRKTKDPDVSYIVSAVEQIARHMPPGLLVLLESTTYPGTTDELILPILEATGLKVGEDFYLAFSPERVDPGNPTYTTRNIPKVVGGITPTCTELAVELYRGALENVVPVSSTRVAEMVKLLENTFRSVNIGLVNELALMCDSMGIDVWEVIDAAATKPFGFMPFYPGPGLGGHCIPIDPFYLSWKARQVGFEARFIELAGQVNSFMPQHVVSKIGQTLNDVERSVRGAKILVLGVAYKSDVDDARESPAIDIIQKLIDLGAHVEYHDTHILSLKPEGIDLESVELTDSRISDSDLVLITTKHSNVDYITVVDKARVVLDTRNVLKGRTSPKIRRL